MTSLRKRYTNWLNARRSTGPRTPAGKARVAQNARKLGLPLPTLRDPTKAKEIGALARKLAGRAADAQRFAAACRLVAAQIDLLNIRATRAVLLGSAREERAVLRRLDRLDRLERYARTQRSRAVRDFGPAGAPGRGSAPTAADGGETIDVAAVLQKPAARKVGRRVTVASHPLYDRRGLPGYAGCGPRAFPISGLAGKKIQPFPAFCQSKPNRGKRRKNNAPAVKIQPVAFRFCAARP